MIEMSVEKETILSDDGKGNTLTTPQSPPPSENTEGGGNKTPKPNTVVPVCVGGSILASAMLSELSANHSTSMESSGQVDSLGLGVRITGKPLQPKNGLQPQPGPQQQPQKLNKRRYSMNSGFKHPGFSKRRRRANSECDPVLPTNFLLGGNIFDPLNLNSLLDEEVNRALNAETPKSSPLPVKNRDPVEILIPKDITDPLNLNGRGGDAHGGVLVSPMKSGGRRRHRNRHHGGGAAGQPDTLDLDRSRMTGEEGATVVPLYPHMGTGVHPSTVPEVPKEGAVLSGLRTVEESPKPYELNTTINCRDEVIPPILPRRQSQPSSNSASQVQLSNADSGSSGQAYRHRKRRRTSSRSDRLSVTPTPATKRPSAERGHSQTFHTPIGGGVTGGQGPRVQQVPQSRHKPQRKFQFGNYSHYYGYRTPGLSQDPRISVFRPEWFHGKNILDLGCNTGHMTLAIAKNWSPAHILGLDIDGRLVHAARQNLRHFLSELHRLGTRYGINQNRWFGNEGIDNNGTRRKRGREEEREENTEKPREKKDKMEDCPDQGGKGTEGVQGLTPLMALPSGQWQAPQPFPISFRICRGPIVAPPLLEHSPGVFPSNVSFMKGNYVLESDDLLASERAEYDVILCLSLTKWVHLNWGDAGLQRLFKRAFRQLRPGGLFILEPQPWSSYSKRKRLTETTYKNYNSIRFKPDQFSSYLTSEVGFSSYELIGVPKSCPRGFQRPIYVFHKGPSSRK
ncbi:7SK snRNA methylphosphate capping enzyme isoform X2 [Chanos chanos]|uniref:RNA methyltransferase n=1 Tax=Chanos chanos TaxID=29144 RepID=A0A6J2VI97_CHACN|nr:7SK snRNA methylphosphate capping enzyme isoform X2 [Chanos chanos]